MGGTGITRRGWLGVAPCAAWGGAAAFAAGAGPKGRADDEPFGYCLNTSTIRGQKLPIAREAALAAAAGYQGIEPWVNELDAHVAAGGSLDDLGKQFRDL